jgi:hypothetical protein
MKLFLAMTILVGFLMHGGCGGLPVPPPPPFLPPGPRPPGLIVPW